MVLALSISLNVSLCFITAAKEVMFSPLSVCLLVSLFVCLFVSRITLNRFQLGGGMRRAKKESITSWKRTRIFFNVALFLFLFLHFQ